MSGMCCNSVGTVKLFCKSIKNLRYPRVKNYVGFVNHNILRLARMVTRYFNELFRGNEFVLHIT